jgi:hypothetical protein
LTIFAKSEQRRPRGGPAAPLRVAGIGAKRRAERFGRGAPIAVGSGGARA